MRMVTAAGFEIVAPPDADDRENLLIVARKAAAAQPAREADPREVEEAEAHLTDYMSARARNLVGADRRGGRDHRLSAAPRGDVGRGAPVRQPGHPWRISIPAALSLLIDKHLKAHVGHRHGRTLSEPDALKDIDPGVDRGDVARLCRRDRARSQGAWRRTPRSSSTPI